MFRGGVERKLIGGSLADNEREATANSGKRPAATPAQRRTQRSCPRRLTRCQVADIVLVETCSCRRGGPPCPTRRCPHGFRMKPCISAQEKRDVLIMSVGGDLLSRYRTGSRGPTSGIADPNPPTWLRAACWFRMPGAAITPSQPARPSGAGSIGVSATAPTPLCLRALVPCGPTCRVVTKANAPAGTWHRVSTPAVIV